MITGKDIYDVLAAIVPLYVAMILAYGSVRWWKIFTPDQCSGINRFVAVFAVPLLSFHFISSNNPYAMDYQFLAADSLQKIIILSALFLWQSFSRTSSLEWMITLFSLSTLPNTLVMGIPLLRAMYGDVYGNLMVQIVVLQSVIWYTLMLFMFEYRSAKLLIFEQFPETAASITSFHVDSDVISLSGREPLETNAEIGDDGKLHVKVRRSSASSRSVISTYNKSNVASVLTPRASNLTGVEIYSIQTSREPTPRGSSFNQSDFYAMFSSKTASPKHVYSSSSGGGDVFSMQSSKVPTPRTSNLEDEMVMLGKKRAAGSGGGGRGRGRGRSVSGELYNNNNSGLVCSYPPPNPIFSSGSTNGGKKKESVAKDAPLPPKVSDSKDLHMLIWSSSESPVSEGRLKHVVNRAPAPVDFRDIDSPKVVLQQEAASIENGSSISDQKEIDIDDMKFQSQASSYTKMDMEGDGNGANKNSQMPPASVMTRLILIMVWRKLIRNPNTYSSLFGLIWSFVSFRFHIEMPTIFKGSISILSDAGLGMAMFSLGLFMALQPKIIACGKQVATFSMAVRFLTGPAVMAACSIAIGIRGPLLHVAIVQAALPQGIVPFVFAKEYNVHPDILSTAVIFGMLIALPITILYYVLLGV